jgi:type I restriction enzyme M protein
MDERKSIAEDEARPYKEEASKKKHEAVQWGERLKELKKAKACDDDAIAKADEKYRELNREVRDLETKVKETEDAVYDLKAVNPHRIQVIDTRTPEELIELIKAKGNEIAEALKLLS